MSSIKWTRLFQAAGYESIIFCNQNSRIHEEAKNLGLNVEPFDSPRDYLSFKTRRRLKELFQKYQPKAVFCHSTRDLWHLSPVLKKYPHIKLVAFARMFIRGVNKKGLLHRSIYSRLDKMIALSHLQKTYLMECLPLPESKYQVIPNGVRTDEFCPAEMDMEIRQQLGASSQHVLIGLIGRLDRLKGHMEVVEAAAALSPKYDNVRFVFVGSVTAAQERGEFPRLLTEKVNAENLGNVVRMTEHRKDIPKVLNALDIFCMPSYEENFGNVLLEAMACGKPSIGTNSGGTPEIIDHQKNGLLVAPQDSKSLAQAFEQLLNSKDLRKSLGSEARKKAEQTYDLNIVFKQVESLIL